MPIGVYDHEPPASTSPQVQSIRLADASSVFAGAGPIAKQATQLRDALERLKSRLVPF